MAALCALFVLLAFAPAAADAGRPSYTKAVKAELRGMAAAGTKLETAVDGRKGALKRVSDEMAAEYAGCSEIIESLSKASSTAPLLASAARLDFRQEAHALLTSEFKRWSKAVKGKAKTQPQRRAAAYVTHSANVAKEIPDFSLCQFIADWEAAEPYRYSPEGFQTVTRNLNPELYDDQKARRKEFAAGDKAYVKVVFRMLNVPIKSHAIKIFGDPYRPAARYVKAGAKLRALQ